jgi:hypothetical protein
MSGNHSLKPQKMLGSSLSNLSETQKQGIALTSTVTMAKVDVTAKTSRPGSDHTGSVESSHTTKTASTYAWPSSMSGRKFSFDSHELEKYRDNDLNQKFQKLIKHVMITHRIMKAAHALEDEFQYKTGKKPIVTAMIQTTK